MADPRHRRRVAAALVTAAMSLAAACGGIPTDGDVTPIKDVVAPDVAGDDPQLDRVRRIVDPKGPVPGAAPSEIVRGFFDAQAAKDHDIARLFLAPSADWSDRGVLVYSGERTVGDVAVSNVQARGFVTVQRVATISAAGEYVPTAPSAVRLEVTLRKVAAEWRLSRVPQGLVLSALTFRSLYRRVVLYHPDPRRQHLVPDFTFLPVAEASASDILDALLRGPSAWLRPAVRSVIPAGTRVLGTPRIIDGVADVDLSLEANATPSDARPALAAQIVRTLTEIGVGVTGVRLRVEGRSFSIPGVRDGEVMSRSKWASFDPTLAPSDERLFFLAKGNLSVLDSDSQSGIARVDAADYLRVGLSRRGELLAAVRRRADGRQSLLVGPIDGPQREALEADSFSTPSWSRESDAVWVVRRSGPATDVVAVPVAVAPERRVRVDNAPGPVHDLRLSPDGNRAVLAIGVGTSRRLYAARVQQAPNLALTGLRPIAPTLSAVTSFSWHSDRGVQVVATQGEPGKPSVRSIFRLDVDGYNLTGDASELDGLPRAPDVIAAAPARVTAVEVGGIIYKKVPAPNSLWTVVGPGRAPVYSG